MKNEWVRNRIRGVSLSNNEGRVDTGEREKRVTDFSIFSYLTRGSFEMEIVGCNCVRQRDFTSLTTKILGNPFFSTFRSRLNIFITRFSLPLITWNGSVVRFLRQPLRRLSTNIVLSNTTKVILILSFLNEPVMMRNNYETFTE